MKKYLLASILASSCLAANAAVINFDGHDNTIFGDEDSSNGIASVSLDGYSFINSGDHFHLVDMAQFGSPSNGTSSLLSDRATTLTMTKDGGGTFSLTSLLGYSHFSSILSIRGDFADGSSINADFAINPDGLTLLELTGFDGLRSVTFTGSPDLVTAPAGFGLEDVVVQSSAMAVPEPLTLGLFGVALSGLALSRRRHLPNPKT